MSVDVTEAARRAELGSAVLLDVREPDEWRAGHAPSAQHLPMSELQERLAEVPRDRPVLAICRSGARSGRVTAALVGIGYEAENVDGGMKAWVKAGLPLVPPDGRVA
jgi:rhodanese-related sulfurtransferase